MDAEITGMTRVIYWTKGMVVKKAEFFLLMVLIRLELCMSPVVTITSIILSSNKIQNGDILVPTQAHLENGH